MAGTNKQLDKVVNVIVSVGAAVVIFGAWAKILHKSFADYMLTVGLLTEAAIFLIYAFLPPAGGELAALVEALPKNGQSGPLASMEEMMAKAEITPENMRRLSDNFSKFGSTVEKMGQITDMHAATQEYAAKTKEAAKALEVMRDAYQGAVSTISHFNAAADSTKQFHEQVQTLTKNLGSLNTIYELELQDTNNHLKAMNSFYGNLVHASQAMQGSVEDAKKTHDQISLLAKNLSNLNQVYGSMLAAMQGRG